VGAQKGILRVKFGKGDRVAESDWEKSQAKNVIKLTRPFDGIILKVKRRKDYEGECRIN